MTLTDRGRTSSLVASATLEKARNKIMETKKIRDLKRGEYFTLKPIEEPKDTQIFIRCDYDGTARKYWGQRFSDCNDGRYFSGDRIVYVGFTF